MTQIMKEQLQELGLSPSEATVYLSLISLHSVPASTLAKHAGVPRSTTKYACEQLVNKGLAKRLERNKCWYYSPCDPDVLKKLIQEKEKTIAEQKSGLPSLIKGLKEQYADYNETSSIRFFEGPEGIIEMLQDVLDSAAPLYGALHMPTQLDPKIKEFFEKTYIPRRKRTKAPAWILFADTQEAHDYQTMDHDMNRISLRVPQDEFPFTSLFQIYDGKLAFYSYEGAIMTGAIIEDQHLTNLQFSLFKMAWNYARLLPDNERFKNVDLEYLDGNA